MIQLHQHAATLLHLNVYTEKHGEDSQSGVALKFQVMMPMATLDAFAQGLVGAVYQKDGLRFPDLGPMKWKRELVGAKVSVDGDDLLGERKVAFDLATVDKFTLTPLNGGTVDITMRVKCKPDADQMGVLYQMLNKEVQLTVDPAKAEDQPAKDERQPELEGVEEE